MTDAVTLNMRDRLASALMTELRNRGLPAGADIAYAVADRALEGTQFATLTGYVAAVEAGGTLEEIQTRLTDTRDRLSDDPLMSELVREL